MDWITDPQAWIALATLTAMEIVLGIDNIVFLTIVTDRLPVSERKSARRIGLALAMLMRIGLLFALSWLIGLQEPLFAVLGNDLSGRDLILIAGGLFLLFKATREIHHAIEGDRELGHVAATATFGGVLVQVALLDMVFSLDSVITAVGMANHIAVMVIAVVVAVGVMILFVNSVTGFVERHPTFKMLALSFLVLIGVALVADGLELHIPKGYIYFAMGFSVFVELLNMRLRRSRRQATRAAAATAAE